MKYCTHALLAGGAFLALAMAPLSAQDDQAADYRAGKSFLETKVYSQAEDQEILDAFEGLRVADVSDGMDFVGLPDTGLMDPEIHALWKDTEDFGHRFTGIAVTARYVPTPMPFARQDMSYEDFRAWEGNWYEAGAVGVVTDGTSRDTDEIAAQEIPLYYRHPGRGIRPGRNEIELVNMAVEVGGVLVMPGDVIVADGDGVIVVPRKMTMDVAAFAHEIPGSDKAGRRELYERTGREPDPSVE